MAKRRKAPKLAKPKPTQGTGKAPDGPQRPAGRAKGMSEQQIRKAGYAIEVPFEVPDPGGADLVYSSGQSAEQWQRPDDFQMGGVPWDAMPDLDPAVAKRFGLDVAEQGTEQGDGDSPPEPNA